MSSEQTGAYPPLKNINQTRATCSEHNQKYPKWYTISGGLPGKGEKREKVARCMTKRAKSSFCIKLGIGM